MAPSFAQDPLTTPHLPPEIFSGLVANSEGREVLGILQGSLDPIQDGVQKWHTALTSTLDFTTISGPQKNVSSRTKKAHTTNEGLIQKKSRFKTGYLKPTKTD